MDEQRKQAVVHGRWEGEQSRIMIGIPAPPMVHLLSHILRMLSKLVLAHNFEGVGRVPQITLEPRRTLYEVLVDNASLWP